MFVQKPGTVEGKKLALIRAEDIAPSTNQPRKTFDEYELWKLSASIRENGILQPLVVRPVKNGYELIAGHRRLKAAMLAGIKELPCIIYDTDDDKAAILTVIENLQRSDLTIFEEAAAISALMNRYGMTQSEASSKLGIAQSTLANKLRLLRLTEGQREKVMAAGLCERHARALIRIDDEEKRTEALNTVIARQLSIAQTEDLVEKTLSPDLPEPPPPPTRACAVGDIRLFINSLNKLVDTLEESGISTKLNKKETAEYTEYTVRIQKQGHPLRLV